MCRIGYILAYLAATGAAPPAVSPDPESLVVSQDDLARSRQLVVKLGSPEFEVREEAQRDLAAMGRRALPALLEALEKSRNPEVRARCHRLVPKAEAADLDARISTFLADTDAKYDHDIPGWEEFRAIAGDEPGARSLFTEIVRDAGNRPLLEAIDRPQAERAQVVADQKERLYSKMYPRRLAPGMAVPRAQTPTLPELAALYLAAACVEPDDGPPPAAPVRSAARTVLTNTKVRNVVRSALDSEEPGDQAFLPIFIAWLETRNEPDELYSATSMVNSLKFVEGLGVAERAALADGLLVSRRAYAVTTLARHGGAERLPSIRKLFNNAAVATSVRLKTEVFPIQLRDVALAMSLRLTDQDPKDYGFRIRSTSTSEATRFSYTNHYFASAAARKAAFEKWEAWERARKDKSGKK